MPVIPSYNQRYAGIKTVAESWDTFRGGLNRYLKESELAKNEFADGENVYLDGKGTLKTRAGTSLYYTAGATGLIRNLKQFTFNTTGNSYLIANPDGYLTKRNGTSYTILTGASFASGYPVNLVMQNDKIWTFSENDSMTYWDESTFGLYNTLTTPTGVLCSVLSCAASGTFVQSYRISALSDTGETLAATACLATGLPSDPANCSVRIAWNAVSAASGVLTGYNIYGRYAGQEQFLYGTTGTATNWIDDGSLQPRFGFTPETVNSTAGKKAKYAITHKDKIVIANTQNGKCRIEWSGFGGNIGKFHWSVGGGYLDINDDSGDEITALYDSFDKVIVWFNNSTYSVDLSQTVTIGDYSIVAPSYQKINGSVGCIGQSTVCQVENDVFFMSWREGHGAALMVLGYEPNVMSDILRTNEISIKVKPILQSIPKGQIEKIHCYYRDKKYHIFYPTSTAGEPDKCLIYDRERTAWNPPHTVASKIAASFTDSSNEEHFLVASSTDTTVNEWALQYKNDNGDAIRTYFKSRKTYFGDWKTFKELRNVFTNFAEVNGTITVRINYSNRSDAVSTAKTRTITNSAVSTGVGIGFDAVGNFIVGNTGGTGTQQTSSDIMDWIITNTIGRYFQLEIESTAMNTYWELLNVDLEARPLSRGVIPGSTQS